MSVFFYAFCEDCGEQVNTCQHCCNTTVDGISKFCKDCKEITCCSHAIQNCMGYPLVKPLYLCEGCKETRYQASQQVWSYCYRPADINRSLSPTNVYRVPLFRPVSEGPTDPVERADEALAAYNEEMKFSGNEEEALKIYVSFYNRGMPDPKEDRKLALREGFVSMQEILAGRHVTGEQFFESLKYPDYGWEEDDSYVGNNPKTMSKQQLRRAIEEVDTDRTSLFLRLKGLRGHEWPEDSQAFKFQLDAWSAQLWSELRNRA